MALKCTNESCGYGPEWDCGAEVTRDCLGRVVHNLRANACGQNQSAAAAGRPHLHGLCLSCLHDQSRAPGIAACI